jgi:hypothetical protein
MQRLLNIERNLVSEPTLDGEEFKRIVFGPNFAERDRAFEEMRKNGMLHHYHITEDSKEEIRYKTMQNVFKSRQSYSRSVDETEADPNVITLFSNGFVFYDLGFCIRSGIHFFLYVKSIQLLGT